MNDDLKHFRRDYIDSFQLIPEVDAGKLLWLALLGCLILDIVWR